MDETIFSIASWHEKTFPSATFGGQIAKFNEEAQEWKESAKKDMFELADMLIVACGMTRFSIAKAQSALLYVFKELDLCGETWIFLKKAVNAKMKENRKRIWKCEGGLYHHVEEKDEK